MEYVTIAEFAEKAGVSQQAVYQRLKKDLAPFAKTENGVKYLQTEALKLFKQKPQGKATNRIQELEAQIERLEADKLDLTMRLVENNEKLLEILEKQAEQIDRQNTQLENYQVLLAQNHQIQQSLIQLPPAPTKVENESPKVESTTKKKRFSLFSKRN